MSNIKIDPELLEGKIMSLTELCNEYEAIGHTPFRIVGKGKTNHSLYEMDTCFLALDKALADLIQSTIALLNNAKDGYVDADEKSAGLLQKLQGEVFGK